MSEKIQKKSIEQLAKNPSKVTIADEIETQSKYRIDPPLTAFQLASCLLDPSELEKGKRDDWKMLIANRKIKMAPAAKDALEMWLSQTNALKSNAVQFVNESGFSWMDIKQKILRKYNLCDLIVHSMSKQINQITIVSLSPLYDLNAHPNRVRNVLRALKLRYPHLMWEHEGCSTSGSCPIGLADALRKLANETHGKVSA